MSEEENKEKEPEKEERRRGPSTYTLSFSGIIAVAGLAASGVATYNAVQNDIAALKKGELYQERTNERLSNEIKANRDEQRETMREFNEKLDRIIETWGYGRNGRRQ
jgi:cell division protein FtsB